MKDGEVGKKNPKRENVQTLTPKYHPNIRDFHSFAPLYKEAWLSRYKRAKSHIKTLIQIPNQIHTYAHKEKSKYIRTHRTQSTRNNGKDEWSMKKNHNNNNNNNNQDRGKIFALNYTCVSVSVFRFFFWEMVVVRVRTIDFIILYLNNIYCSLASLHAQSLCNTHTLARNEPSHARTHAPTYVSSEKVMY